MRLGVLLILLGCLAMLSSLAMYANDRHLLENDLVDIGRMRTIVDSNRAQLARATTAAESTKYVDQIRSRGAGIARRQFHVPLRQERVTGWWRPAGPGTLSIVIGALLTVAGFAILRPTKRTA
jgi:hypothetical protein